jgi:hypothetical protein
MLKFSAASPLSLSLSLSLFGKEASSQLFQLYHGCTATYGQHRDVATKRLSKTRARIRPCPAALLQQELDG